VRDIAELLLEGVQKTRGVLTAPAHAEMAPATKTGDATPVPSASAPVTAMPAAQAREAGPSHLPAAPAAPPAQTPERKKWRPAGTTAPAVEQAPSAPATSARGPDEAVPAGVDTAASEAPRVAPSSEGAVPAPERKKWAPKAPAPSVPAAGAASPAPEEQAAADSASLPASTGQAQATAPTLETPAPERKKWQPKTRP
jgi:hypothetical protein